MAGTPRQRRTGWHGSREDGTALVEFALVLPVLLLLVLGIIDFGLYFYDDLRLTQAARDAVRYASVGQETEANAAIDGAALVSASITQRTVSIPADSGGEASVTLRAAYQTLTPLPRLAGIGSTLTIDATALMRRE